MSLTGDELTLNDKSYKIKDNYGNYFILGKLITREKSYSPVSDSYSLYNNTFVFENIPEDKNLRATINGSHHVKMFDEVIGGGKKMKKRKQSRKHKSTSRKNKSTRRKSSRRR